MYQLEVQSLPAQLEQTGDAFPIGSYRGNFGKDGVQAIELRLRAMKGFRKP